MIEKQKTSSRIMLTTMVLWTFFIIIIGGRSGMDLHGIRHGEVVFGILFLGSYVDQKKGVQPEG
jgi:hypothetical protein